MAERAFVPGEKSTKTVKTSRAATRFTAECSWPTCHFVARSGNYDRDRMAARRHAERNPTHLVITERRVTVTYRAAGSGGTQ